MAGNRGPGVGCPENNRIDEGEWALNDVQGPRRYMVGDRIIVELDLEHWTNLGKVFVAFAHETDPLTEVFSRPRRSGGTGDRHRQD